MTNDLARINGQLELLAMANCGPNTECTFSLQEIPYQGDLLKTLEVVFPAGIRYMDKKPYSTEDWQVATQRLDVDAALVLKSKINKWCFHMPYSPTLPGGG
ncbi:hypothetical protein [Leeia sp.]|uniref:hypothetical protein n=1 Tax=Leeia sp. TaxID=2884678 RepID=UPI0035B13741